MAPTPPIMDGNDFLRSLDQFMYRANPEVIFWEPINARGQNAQRMIDAGLAWAESIRSARQLAKNFFLQLDMLDRAATRVDCRDRIHVWPDPAILKYEQDSGTGMGLWIGSPTCEEWPATEGVAA